MINQKLVTDDYYSTSDLALATAISLFYPIDLIDHRNPQKAEFLFKRSNQIDKLVESFFRGEMRVSPQAYFFQLRSIKTRLREAK
jgi:hypothetical protein